MAFWDWSPPWCHLGWLLYKKQSLCKCLFCAYQIQVPVKIQVTPKFGAPQVFDIFSPQKMDPPDVPPTHTCVYLLAILVHFAFNFFSFSFIFFAKISHLGQVTVFTASVDRGCMWSPKMGSSAIRPSVDPLAPLSELDWAWHTGRVTTQKRVALAIAHRYAQRAGAELA